MSKSGLKVYTPSTGEVFVYDSENSVRLGKLGQTEIEIQNGLKVDSSVNLLTNILAVSSEIVIIRTGPS